MMKSITFTCETITPMFLSGADGQTPELRAPSIKGALRFWWRAVNGHLGLGELKEREALIFGNTDGRSQLTLNVKLLANNIDNNALLVPHKGMKGKAFEPKTRFEVTISLSDKKSLPITFDQVQALFEIACLLGGNGKRTRRGMGSYRIMEYEIEREVEEEEILEAAKYVQPSSLEDIHKIISKLTPYYAVSKNYIHNIFAGRMELYPWIAQIHLGKNSFNKESELTNLISKTTNKIHSASKRDESAYESSLGHARGGRFASPIYVSVMKTTGGVVPIITTLNTCPNRNINKIDLSMQEDFKNEILK